MSHAAKIPLVLCSRHFFSLNASQTIFLHVSNDTNNTLATPPFIFTYMQIPISLEHLTLLEAAHCWSFSPNRKKIHGNQTCVTRLLESFHNSLPFLPLILQLLNRFVGVNFFYTNLLIPSLRDIGTTTSKIISHWHHIKGTYVVWHVERA